MPKSTELRMKKISRTIFVKKNARNMVIHFMYGGSSVSFNLSATYASIQVYFLFDPTQ